MAPEKKHNMPNPKIEGRYTNHFNVGHNAYEFVFEFSQLYDENEEAELCARIITSPFYAKTLLMMLEDAVDQYEQRFGPINL